MQYDDFSEAAIVAFWNEVEKQGMSTVDVALNAETATLSAKTHGKEFTDTDFVSVQLNAYDVMLQWDRLADSWVTDEGYYASMDRETGNVIKKALNLKPTGIEVLVCEVN